MSRSQPNTLAPRPHLFHHPAHRTFSRSLSASLKVSFIKLWSQRGLAQLRALALPPYTTRRRDDSLELLAWITSRIDQLDERIAAVVDTDPHARLLLTHPGVGPLTALTTVLILGPVPPVP